MVQDKTIDLQDLVSHCKKLGFIYQSSEVYGGLSAVYDYGPYGVLLKNNILGKSIFLRWGTEKQSCA